MLLDESLIEEFEESWFAGESKRIEEILPRAADSHRLGTLLELIRVEIELSWRQWRDNPDESAKPETVESFLRRFPAIEDDLHVAELLKEEYRVRELVGDHPSAEEYRERFPDVCGSTELSVDVTKSSELLVGSHHSADLETPLVAPPDRYRVLGECGRGGFGVVYLVLDRKLGREVALKQLLRHANDRARRKFLNEARITAKLEHPGIVAVHDVSGLEDDVPYYTMQLVRGRTLSEQIDSYHHAHSGPRDGQQRLELQRLLQSFLTVVRAMEYAHDRQVIHRDLKPHNIITGAFGETVILDWGLGKDLGQPTDVDEDEDFPSHSPTVSRRGDVKGTPAYMSPEQAAGNVAKVDARSDIYSLGVMLFELLTGEKPFRGDTGGDVIQLVLTADVPAANKLNPQIPRSLSAICSKAMARQQADRYQTASDFVSDLENYLADRPVQACQETFVSQGLRWLRNHRTVVTGGISAMVVGLICLSIMIVLLSSAFQSERTAKQAAISGEERARVATRKAERNLELFRQQQQEAEQQREQAEASLELAKDSVQTLLVTITKDPRLTGMQPLMEKLLREAQNLHQALADQAGDDDRLIRQRFEAHMSLVDIRGQLGRNQRALESLAAAQSHLSQLRELHPGDLQLRFEQAGMLRRWAATHSRLKQTEASQQKLEACLEILKQLDGSGMEQESVRHERSLALGELAALYVGRGEPEPARRLYMEMLAICEQRLSVNENNVQAIGILAGTRLNLAHLINEFEPQKRSSRARRETEKGVEWLRKGVMLDRDGSALMRIQLTQGLHNLSILQSQSGDQVGAAKSMSEAIRLGIEVTKQHPEVPLYQSQLASRYANFATLMLRQKKIESASHHFQQAIAIHNRPVLAKANLPDDRLGLATCQINLATCLVKRGNPTSGRSMLLQGIRTLEPLVKAFPKIPKYRLELGKAYLLAGHADREAKRYQPAQHWYGLSASCLERYATQHPKLILHRDSLAAAHHHLGVIAEMYGKRDVADRHIKKSFTGAEGLKRAVYLFVWSDALRNRGDLPAAIKAATESTQLFLQHRHPRVTDPFKVLCRLHALAQEAENERLMVQVVLALREMWSDIRQIKQLTPGTRQQLRDLADFAGLSEM